MSPLCGVPFKLDDDLVYDGAIAGACCLLARRLAALLWLRRHRHAASLAVRLCLSHRSSVGAHATCCRLMPVS